MPCLDLAVPGSECFVVLVEHDTLLDVLSPGWLPIGSHQEGGQLLVCEPGGHGTAPAEGWQLHLWTLEPLGSGHDGVCTHALDDVDAGCPLPNGGHVA